MKKIFSLCMMSMAFATMSATDPIPISSEAGLYPNGKHLVYGNVIAEAGDDVVYDVVPTSYKPANESVIDLEARQFDSIEIFFSSNDIQVRKGAAVEVIPVGYESETLETFNVKAIPSMKKILIGFAPVEEIDPDNEVYQGIEYNGVYEVIIPKGTFGDADWINDPATGHSNEEIILKYEVVGGLDRTGAVYSLEPTSVTWTDDFKSFTLAFPEGTEMTDEAFATLDCFEAKYAKHAEFTDNGDSTFTVEFDEAPTESGTYIFAVGKGMFGDAEFVAAKESGIANKEYRKEITIDHISVNPQPFTVSPEPGSEVDELSSVILTLNAEDGYDHFEVNSQEDIYFTFNGERFCEAYCKENGNSLEVKVTDIVSEAGEYALVIEPNAISWATADYSMFSDNEEQFVFNYTFAGATINPTAMPFNVSPASGSEVESLDGVTLTLIFEEGYDWIEVDEYNASFRKDGEVVAGVQAEVSDDWLEVVLRPSAPITEPGEYELYIESYAVQCGTEDEGKFYINEEPLAFTYILTGGEIAPATIPFNVSPASGSEVESLDGITLTLIFEEGYDWIEVEEYNASFRKDGEVVAGVQAEVSDDWLEVVLRPSAPITEPGEYELYIEPYTVQCGTEDEGKFYINEEPLVYTYTLVKVAGEVVYDVVPTSYKPADESVIDLEETQFDSIEVFFSSDDIQVREGAAIEIIPVGYESEAFETLNVKAIPSMKKIFIGFAPVEEIDPDNEVYQGIEYNGVYEVIIPKGTFGDSDWINDPATGHSNDEIILTYEVIGGMERGAGVEYTLEPTSVTWTDDLKSFTLTFPEGTMMVDAAFAHLDNIEAKYMKYAEFVDNGDSTFTVEFDEAPSESGNYIFTVTAGSFGDAEFVTDEMSGVANPEITKVIEFVFTGINSVSVDNAKEGVYNLFGVKISDTTDNLPAGIYIVGGKKVIIK